MFKIIPANKQKIGKRCVVNVANGKWFPIGQERLMNGLLTLDGTTDIVLWKNCLPDGSPTHEIAPYAFKIGAIDWARKHGYTSVFWLDAAMVIKKQPFEAWDQIEKKGHLFVMDGTSAAAWISDRALEKIGRTRDEVANVPLIFAGIIGLNFDHQGAVDFFEKWSRWVLDGDINHAGERLNKSSLWSEDPRCMGHGYDQTPASIIRHDLGLETTPYGKFFAFNDDAAKLGSIIAGAGL